MPVERVNAPAGVSTGSTNWWDAPDLVPQQDTETENWWDAPDLRTAEDDYGWGIKNAFMRGVTRVGQLTDLAQRDWEEYAQGEKALEQYPVSEEDQKRMAKLQESDGFWASIGEYVKNPSLALQVVAESLPISAPILAGGAAGAVAGSAVPGVGTTIGGMAGVGAGSFTVDYLASLSSKMSEEGIDATNPKELKKAYSDPEFMARARDYAFKHGVPVAAFDALSMGIAGRLYKPIKALAGTATRTGAIAGGTAEMLSQGFTGAAGEAGGEIAVEGKITSMPEVAAEFVGEMVPGIGEIAINKAAWGKAAAPALSPSPPLDPVTGEPLASVAPNVIKFPQKPDWRDEIKKLANDADKEGDRYASSAIDEISTGDFDTQIIREGLIADLNEAVANEEISKNEARQSLMRFDAAHDRYLNMDTKDARLFDPVTGEPLASVAPQTNPFYSALDQTVSNPQGMPRKGTAAQYKSWLDGQQNRGAFKAEERDWIGLDEWLEEKGTATREEVQQFVAENQVEIQEVTKGDDSGEWEAYYTETGQTLGTYPNRKAAQASFPEHNIRRDYFRVREVGGSSDTKFEAYQLPGGENYRELLLTLPRAKEQKDTGFAEYVANTQYEKIENIPANFMAAMRKNYEVDTAGAAKQEPIYTGGHYDEPNILAHVRFNDRVDENGGKMLFLEEVQSDWHQAGREKGYATIEQQKIRDEYARLRDQPGGFPDTPEAIAVRTKLQELEAGNLVPNAPFKQTMTKTGGGWAGLAMKRMLRYAVDNGYDSIGWTTGEQQVERYDLSKQVDEVISYQYPNGDYQIRALKDGDNLIEKDATEAELPGIVGKDLAEKIVNEHKRKSDTQQRRWSGVDLKVGGEGMKKFYDEMLVNNTNRFVKKWGGRVGEANIDQGEYKVMRQAGATLPFRLESRNSPDVISRHATAEEAWAEAERLGNAKVHSLKITPAMKAAGPMPLFSTPRPAQQGKLTLDQLTNAVSEALAPEHAALVNVVQSAADVPGYQNMQKIGGYEGFYDPGTGQVYLIADNLSSENRAKWVAWHELFHRGVRVKYGALLSDAITVASRNGTVKKLADAIMADRVMTENQRGLATEEALAELNAAQRTGNYADLSSRYGVDIPESLQAGWRNALKRFVQTLRNIMSRVLDIPLSEVSDAEIWSLMQGTDVAMGEITAPAAQKMEQLASVAPRYADPVLQAASNKIGRNETLPQKLRRIFNQNWHDRIQQGMFDKFYGILKAVESMGGDVARNRKGYVSARLSTSIQDRLAVILKHSKIKWENGVLAPVEGTEGFLKILEPVADRIEEFGRYLVGVRAREIEASGKKTGFSEAEIDKLIGLGDTNPDFESVRLKYMDFNESILDVAMDAGLIDSKTRQIWESDNYIPFYRVMEEGTIGPRSKRSLSGQQFGRRLKGSEKSIGDPIENIMMNWAHLLDASVKNRALLDVISDLKGSTLMEKLPGKLRKRFVGAEPTRKKVEAELEKAGIESGVADMLSSAPTLSGLMDVWSIEAPAGADIIRVMRHGKAEYYRVHDPLLLRSLSSVNEKAWGKEMEFFRMPKRLLTSMVTADPAFMARNFIRDTLGSFVLGRDRMTPVISGLKGVAKAYSEDWDMVRFMAAGGTFSTGGYLNASDPTAMKRFVMSEAHYRNFEKTLLNSPKRLWDFWQHLGSSVENANRVAVGLAALKNGKDMANAAYEMKDIMDFSMRGDYAVIQFLAEAIPFFSARLQGMHRLGRGVAEHPGAFALKGGLLTFAAMALYMSNRDDDRYRELEEWDKDTYFHFWVGDSHYRLPKPFEVGVLFGTFPERMAEAMIEENSGTKELLKRLKWNFSQTLSMNPIPQVAKPLYELWANRSAFTGRPIVGTRLANLKAEAQYEPWTSATMRELGRAWGVSPKHAEALARGYFGTIGSYILATTDIVTRRLYDYPNPPSMKLEEMPVISAFYRGTGTSRDTKYTTEFYEFTTEVDGLYSAINNYRLQGDKERATELLEENRDKLRWRKLLNVRQASLAQLNRQIRAIHYSKTLPPDEKTRRIKLLEARKNKITQQAVERVGGAF